jgi:hypothetical protein
MPRDRLSAPATVHALTVPERRIRRRVANLLRVLERRSGELTTAVHTNEHSRHFAAAGLARCRALLEGIYLLTARRGRADVAGVLLRTLTETWAVACLVLLKGTAGIFELAPGAAEELRRATKAFEPPTPGLSRWLARFRSMAKDSPVRHKAGPRKGEPRPLSVGEVFGQVVALAGAAGDSDLARRAKHAHERIWRVESYVSAHANLASISILYLNEKGGSWGIVDRPTSWMSMEQLLVAGGQLTGALAMRVYEKFGYRREPVSRLLRGIHIGLHPAAPAPPRARRRKQGRTLS